MTMGSWLSEREQRLVAGAETASAATPIPTQIVSNGEYLPPPQSETQKRLERRILELADTNAKRLGLSRRQFMRTSCGMAAAFLAMREIYGGNVFQVEEAEAREMTIPCPCVVMLAAVTGVRKTSTLANLAPDLHATATTTKSTATATPT